MTDRFIVNYSTQQIKQWVEEAGVVTPKQKRTIFKSPEALAEYVSFLPPAQIFKNVSRLVLQEGVDPRDIDLYIVDNDRNSHCVTINLSARYKDAINADS